MAVLRTAAVSLLITLGVHMAAAQSAPVPQSAVLNPPPYCKASTLTGTEFMQSIQAIIAHGDLTDVAFNEKTLDTKFTADPYWEAYSPPNPQILHLSSDQVLGSKIHTEVIVFKAKSQQLKNGFIAGLGFGGPPNFIADCLHIPISHFASFFGGNFSGLPTGEGIPTASETNVLGSPGKNGTHLHVTFDYGFDKNVVTAVSVYQQP